MRKKDESSNDSRNGSWCVCRGYEWNNSCRSMEMVETSMTYVEGMIEYAESYRGEVNSVVENVTSYVEAR